jgi:predicted negative regulator of RcsB-dependent stress response
VDRITRKELKQDRFAQEVGHTVEFLGEHRQQAIRIGAIVLAAVLLVVGILAWRGYQARSRQQALAAALEVYNGAVGQNPLGGRTFATEEEKRKESIKAFSDVAARYGGSDAGVIASYYLGVIAADQGNMADAEKQFRVAVEEGNDNYASLASLALADIYVAQGKTADAEKLLRGMMNDPTDFVSKQQAQVVLGRALARTNPAEARKLLEPLRTENSAVSRAAEDALTELNAARK